MIRRPVFRCFGGKFRMADWIIERMPPHKIYVEPFGGAGSVLMRKPKGEIEIYNDVFGEIVNVFRVLRDPVQATRLAELCRLTPFARDEFNASEQSLREKVEDPVERARLTLFRSMASFGSAGLNSNSVAGFRTSISHRKKYGMEWVNYPDHICSFTERLQGVVVENRDAIVVIKDYDEPATLFYVDPPYLQSSRSMDHGNARYVFDMEDFEHRNLLRLLNDVQGAVLISGYRCDLYDDLLAGWPSATRRNTHGGRGGSSQRWRNEMLWFKPAAGAADIPLFWKVP